MKLRSLALAILFSAVSSFAQAPAPKPITSSVCFQDGAGNCLANGKVTLQLTQAAMIAPAGQVVPAVPIYIQLDGTGNIPAGKVIWGNDQLLPKGTGYSVAISNAAGTVVSRPNYWVIQGSSPVDLATEQAVNPTVSFPQVLSFTGSPVPGNCAKWFSFNTLEDAGPCNFDVITNWQFGSNPAITGAGNYLQLTMTSSTLFSLIQTGNGSPLSPYVDTIAIQPQAGNCVIASPANGSAAVPLCRSLVAGDLTAIPIATYLPVPVRNGDIIYFNAINGWTTVSGNNVGTATFAEGPTGLPFWQTNSVGLTSVGLTQTGNILTITNSPLTSNGAINIAFAPEPANTFFANCTGAPALPTFCTTAPYAMFPTSTATAGSYSNANITINAQGIVTAAANGASAVSNITVNGGSGLTGTVNFQNGGAVDGITINAQNLSASNITFVIAGALTNAGLANPSVTVAGATCTLGSTCAPIYSDLSGLPALAGNTPSITNQVLTAYNSTTGAFTQAQLAFSNISGNLANSQLTASGVTAGSYTNSNITVNAQGIVTAAASGSGGGGSNITVNGGSPLSSPVNFQTSTGGNIVNGITLVPVNSSGSNIQFAISGTLTNAGLANPSMTVSTATCTLGGSCTVPYSGVSGTPQLAQTINATASSWLNSYTASTGIFTTAQPAFTDITGLLVNSQLPTSAVTPGTYTNATIVVNAQGIVTSASNGSGGGSSITVNGGSALGSPANFVNSAAVNGITLNASNPTGNNVTFTFSGSLTNAGLANPSITISGSTCTLGGSCTIAYSGLSGLPALPANTPGVGGDYLSAYNSTTGAFTLTALPTLFYQTIQASGGAAPQEPKLNFIEGTNMTIGCVDNVSATRTDCTFTMGASFGNVSSSGGPASPQLAQWVSSTAIQGISMFGGGTNPVSATANGTLLAGQILCANSSAIFTNCTPGIPVTQQTSGSGFTVANALRANLQVLNTNVAVTVNLPAPSVLPNNYFADFYNVSIGPSVAATFSTSGGTFIQPGNLPSTQVPVNGFAILYNDGTNYWLPTMPTYAAFPNTPNGFALAYSTGSGLFTNTPVSNCGNALTSNALVIGNSGGCVGVGNADFLYTSHTLAGGASAILDMSASSGIKLPTASAFAATATSMIGYDSTGKNEHIWANGVSSRIATFPDSATLTAGDCVQFENISSYIYLNDSGSPCGSSVTSITGDGSLISNSASTGAVTLTLHTAIARSVWANTASTLGAPTGYTNSPSLIGVQFVGSTSGACLVSMTASTGLLNICAGTLQISGGQIQTYNNNALTNSGIPSEISDTDQLSSHVSLGPTVMATVSGTKTKFVFSGTVAQVTLGTSCTVGGSVGVNVIYTDALSGAAITEALDIQSAGLLSSTLSFASSSGPIGAANVGSFSWSGYATNATNISYSTTYAGGTGCTGTAQAYGITPILTYE